MVIEDKEWGINRYLQSGVGKNANDIKSYNKELKQCKGDCTLLQPTLITAASRVSSFSTSAALPVALLSWDATATPEGVELKWETGVETENDYFTVLRSANGYDFEEVARVSGYGTRDARGRYRLLDENAPAGMQFYRLEQVDYDGTRTVLAVRQVEVLPSQALPVAGISPNPAASGTRVRVHLSNPAGTPVRLVDLAGRPVAEAGLDAAGGFQLPGNLQPGLYVMIVRDQALRIVVRP